MKRSIFQKIILVFLIHLAPWAAVLGQDGWLELRTEHFILNGKISETEITEVALKLERFHQVFSRTLPKTQAEIPFQTRVIIFKSESDLNFIPKTFAQTFFTLDDANYAILSLANPDSFEAFYAGYTRFLLENNVGLNLLPAWLLEALTEHFQTFKINDPTILEFENSARNFSQLKKNNPISVDVLLQTDHFTLRNQAEERKQLFRAESWFLLQYLLNKAPNLEKIEKFIELKKQGIETQKALAAAFQIGLAKIREEFPKFIETNNFSGQRIDLGEQITVENNRKATQISESEKYALQADFLFYANRWKESEPLIEKTLQIEPNQSLALTTRALIKAQGYYYSEAENLCLRAIQQDPDDYLNHYRYALVLSKRGMTEFGFVSGYNSVLASQMRQSLDRAIELNPSFTGSYALAAFVNSVRNELLDDSIGVINQALKIAPGNQLYQLRLAELYLRKEKFTEARKLALQVLQNTAKEGVKLYAQNTIQRIDNTEYQLDAIRNRKAKYVNDDIVTDKPLSAEEIKRLQEKAYNDQIRAGLQRPGVDEKRMFGSLVKIECTKNRADFWFRTQNGLLKFYSNSLDSVRLLSLVEEMSDYRLTCGGAIKENNAAIIIKNEREIVSIEFVPKGFK